MRVAAGLWLCLAALMTAACGGLPQRALIPVPPATLGDGWRSASVSTPDVAGAPAPLQPLKPAQWVKASYRAGERMALVQVFGMPTEASAFEARQKWRSEDGSTAFHKGNLFVVCSSESMAMAQLLEFSGLVEREWLRGAR